MHRPAFAGTKRRTWPTHSRPCRTRPLKDGLTRNRTSWSRTRTGGWLSDRYTRSRRRSFVHWTRSDLRYDHARGWSRRCGLSRRCYWTRRRDWRCRRRNGRSRGRGRSRRHNCRRWNCRHWTRRRYNRLSCNRSWSFDLRRRGRWLRRSSGHNRFFCCRWGGDGRCRRSHNRSRGCNRSRRFCGNRRCCGSRRRRHCCGPLRRMLDRFLLLCDCSQYIAGTRNVRQINLGLDFLFAARRMGRFRRLRGRLPRTAQVRPHFFGFVFFERAGVSLLLGDSDYREHIQNGFALDFQFSCEIVDSNLTHPPFRVLRVVPRSSLRPHGVSFLALVMFVSLSMPGAIIQLILEPVVFPARVPILPPPRRIPRELPLA
jgi:hypothetical protein